MDNLEKSLNEEIKRFNQIGYNSRNLQEQMLGTGNGSGFVQNQGKSDKLEKFEIRQQEMSEQEDSEDETETATFDEMGVGDEDGGELDIDALGDETAELDTPPPPPPVPPVAPAAPVATDTPTAEEDATEVEVTDLVDKQENLEKNTEETNDKLESLMDMLDGMEEKLSGMDQLMVQISGLEEKIEQYRPKSEKEKIEMRKLDSGPYNQTLANFWEDGQDKYEAQGKKEYVLTSDEVNNFSDSEIQQTFNN